MNQLKTIDPKNIPVVPVRKEYAFYSPVQVEEQVNLAYDLYRNGDFEKAYTYFIRSLEIKETSLANRCIGDILFTRNDSTALVYYQKAYSDYKLNIRFLLNMAILYVQYQQKDDAKKLLEEIKKLNPDFKKIPQLEAEIKKLKV